MNSSINTTVSPATVLADSTCHWEGSLSNGVGTTTGTPLAVLSADANALVLSGTLGTFRFARAAVVRLGRGMMYPWFFTGIRIHHNTPDYPAELQFKPQGVSSRDILARLRALGYPVA